MLIAFNATSQKDFAQLTESQRAAIILIQTAIEYKMRKLLPDAVATSGYRSIAYNASIGGSIHSLHISGLARDFRYNPAFKSGFYPEQCLMVEDHIKGTARHFHCYLRFK